MPPNPYQSPEERGRIAKPSAKWWKVAYVSATATLLVCCVVAVICTYFAVSPPRISPSIRDALKTLEAVVTPVFLLSIPVAILSGIGWMLASIWSDE